jgi:hypothetical protein
LGVGGGVGSGVFILGNPKLSKMKLSIRRYYELEE